MSNDAMTKTAEDGLPCAPLLNLLPLSHEFARFGNT